jgi:nucleotide-binding universal stress UspA family protein
MRIPRIEYRKILYATDLSEAGRAAFPYAASIARHYDADLTVFHVLKPPEFENYLIGFIDEELWREIKTRDLEEVRNILVSRKRDDAVIKERVEEFCQSALADYEGKPSVVYDVRLSMGDPVTEIVKEARDGNYDLVVIGKHGRGLLEESVMGTTARRVLRRCGQPVMVVPLP